MEEFWQASCAEHFPTMTANIHRAVGASEGDDCVEGDADGEPRQQGSSSSFWRERFAQRYARQRTWDARRLDQQRLRQQRSSAHRQQALSEDKQRGQNFRGQASVSEGKTAKTQRSVRQRTCRRCGVGFLPSDTAPDACRWHRGQFCRLVDGVLENLAPNDMKAVEKAVQQAIRANGRKKKSRQPNLVVPGASGGQRSEDSWAWSCCGEQSMIAPGCSSGPHS